MTQRALNGNGQSALALDRRRRFRPGTGRYPAIMRNELPQMGEVAPARGNGWLAVAAVMMVIGALGVFNALWMWLVEHRMVFLLALPVNLLMGYWLVMGAWRRANPTSADQAVADGRYR